MSKVAQKITKRKVGSKYCRRIRNRAVWAPSLNLAGIWMRDAGFKIGERVDVIVVKGKIIIQN
ncbi:SymE family type I addiction module toxin [Arundinibacter roseus]|uniref:Type I addiction module toxin, SymE family n=1 Tax=Arundinibacter roseus TaxID=2070510 RepID=A0A4R4KCI9_9BACT|nr:type I addiction module toxin, SymE family [Arundinibacter roseus]